MEFVAGFSEGDVEAGGVTGLKFVVVPFTTVVVLFDVVVVGVDVEYGSSRIACVQERSRLRRFAASSSQRVRL